MARLKRVNNYGDRVKRLALRLRRDVVDGVLSGAEEMAHDLAVRAPVDTGRLLSNFSLGFSEFHFPYRNSFVKGEKGNRRHAAIAKLDQLNRKVRADALKIAVLDRTRRFIFQVRNPTPYLEYVDKHKPFVDQTYQEGVAKIRLNYQRVRLKDGR